MLRNKNKYIPSILWLLLCIPTSIFSQAPPAIIPQPVSLTVQQGSFLIDPSVSIEYPTLVKEIGPLVSFFSSSIQKISGYSLPINNTKAKNKTIRLELTKLADVGQEGYKLLVTPGFIEIKANTVTGLFYGIQTIIQTLPAIRTNALLKIPCMEVTDYPRFKWRGMMLDVSRHFFSPEMVKEYIDLMALYKMNVFHWHLCDDGGWRLEIKKYPKLTQVGAWRVNRTGSLWTDSEPALEGEEANYGGFYTQQQVREIVAYARARNVTIVPEIEMPGHSGAALAAYPYLSCSQKPQRVIMGGVYPEGFQSNYCVGNDSVFTFLQDVLSEVIDLFPSPYIHIGGDEVNKSDWKRCPKCQARMKAQGLKDENELQSYLVQRMEKFLLSKNRKLVGWDEILEGGLAPEATVMSWRGEQGGIQAAKLQHQVVMTPGTPCYFDHYQAGPEGEPSAIGGMNTLAMVYAYEPIPKELNDEEAKFILGTQANLWTEYIASASQVEYMILPRMLALAEVVWSPKNTRNWADFNQRILTHLQNFDAMGLKYCPGNYKIDIRSSCLGDNVQAVLSSEVFNGAIYYTLDGSDPNTKSLRYTAPLEVKESMTMKAISVVNHRVMGVRPTERTFVIHKACCKKVTYETPPDKSYLADGPNSLTDAMEGSADLTKFWHGFSGNDMVATIDLEESKLIEQISLGCLQKYDDYVFLPLYVKFETSIDGKHYTEMQTVYDMVDVNDREVIRKEFNIKFPQQTTRYIRITAKNQAICPKGHPGEGQTAWLFVDEVVVR